MSVEDKKQVVIIGGGISGEYAIYFRAQVGPALWLNRNWGLYSLFEILFQSLIC